MKKLHLFFSTFLLISIFAACSGNGETKVEYIPFKAPEGDQWGMISTDGKVLCDDEYEICPTVATCGRYWVRNHRGYWELHSTDKKSSDFEGEYRYVTIFRNNRAIVAKRDENVTVIDRDGKVVTELSKIDNYVPDQFMNYNDGVVVFTCNEKQGLASIEGKLLVKPTLASINMAYDGKVVAADEDAFKSSYADTVAGNNIVFDYEGKELLKLPVKKYKRVGSRFYGKYLAVGKKGTEEDTLEWGIIDETGKEIVIPSKKYQDIPEINDDMFIYYDGERYGVSKLTGEKVLAAQYNYIRFAGNGYIIASKLKNDANEDVYDIEDMQVRLLNAEGKPVLPGKYLEILPLIYDNVFVQIESDRWSILNLKGEKLKELPKIGEVNIFSEGDYIIESDKVNIKQIVKKLDLDGNSLDELTFTSSVRDALDRQASYFSATNVPKASDYSYTDEVNIFRRLDGVSVNETVKFPNKLSHQNYRTERVIDFWIGWTYYYHNRQIPTGYTFTTSKPKYFEIQFDNYGKLRGKLKSVYKELCNEFAKIGKEEEKNGAATLFKLDNGRWAIVYLEPHSVVAKWGDLSSSERAVYPYYGNKEDLSWEEEPEGDY